MVIVNTFLRLLIRGQGTKKNRLLTCRSSTNSSSQTGLQQDQQPQAKNEHPKSFEASGGPSASSSSRGFTNFLTTTFKNNEGGRPRIPSSRIYPSSPILPASSSTNSVDQTSMAPIWTEKLLVWLLVLRNLDFKTFTVPYDIFYTS